MRNNSTNRKNVAIIGSVGIPAAYGGFETLVEYLASMLGDRHDMHVYCSSKRYELRPARHHGAKLHYVPLDANGLSSIPYDILSMIHASRYADVILVLGVSGCVFLPILRVISSAKIVLNVDGMEWRRDKWGRFAKWFLRISEGLGVRNADIVVSDNAVIKNYLGERYGSRSVCIAYGGDHANHIRFEAASLSAYPFLDRGYAIKVCRIEPENNVHIILDAFSRLEDEIIVVIGNWQHSTYGKEMYQKYSCAENIHLLNPIYDRVELDRIRSNASIYVHGHSAGGTNPSLVEAMWLSLPVIAYDIGYNRETTEGRAMYFRESVSLCRQVIGMTRGVQLSVGREMHEIAERRYKWSSIVNEYATLFADTE